MSLTFPHFRSFTSSEYVPTTGGQKLLNTTLLIEYIVLALLAPPFHPTVDTRRDLSAGLMFSKGMSDPYSGLLLRMLLLFAQLEEKVKRDWMSPWMMMAPSPYLCWHSHSPFPTSLDQALLPVQARHGVERSFGTRSGAT